MYSISHEANIPDAQIYNVPDVVVRVVTLHLTNIESVWPSSADASSFATTTASDQIQVSAEVLTHAIALELKRSITLSHTAPSTMATSILARKRDLVYLTFFVIHLAVMFRTCTSHI